MAKLSLSALVVHLFEAVVALIVTPIDEDRSVIDTRAILAPTFKSQMGFGQGSYGRSVPGEIALGSISAEDYSGVAFAVSFASCFVLPRVTNIKDTDGSYEIELWPTDIDVGAVLNEPAEPVAGNEIVDWQGLEWSAVVGPVQGFKDAVSVV